MSESTTSTKDLNELLDAIAERVETHEDGSFLQRAVTENRIIDDDVPFLLGLVREQAATLAKVRELIERNDLAGVLVVNADKVRVAIGDKA